MKVFLADIDAEHLEKAQEQVRTVIAENNHAGRGGGEVEAMVVDVAKLEDVVALKEKVMELWGEVSLWLASHVDQAIVLTVHHRMMNQVAILMNNASPSSLHSIHTTLTCRSPSRDPN